MSLQRLNPDHSWLHPETPAFAHPPGLLLILLWSEGLLATVGPWQPQSFIWELEISRHHHCSYPVSLAGLSGRLPFSTQPSPSSSWPPLCCSPISSLYKVLGHSWLRLSLSLFTCLKCGSSLRTLFFLKIYHLFSQVNKSDDRGSMDSQPALCSPFLIVSVAPPKSQGCTEQQVTEDPIKVDWTKSSRTDLGLLDSLRVFYLFTLLLCPQWLMVSFLRHHM